jgi:hypothetical protein
LCRRPRRFLGSIGAGLLALGLSACWTDSDSLTPSASVTTLMAGWERHFKLEWTVESRAAGVALRGFVTSTHGARAEPMRLLAQALDASGTLVENRIVWVVSGVGGFQRAYFEFSDLPPADRYRVSVWDYTFQQS